MGAPDRLTGTSPTTDELDNGASASHELVSRLACPNCAGNDELVTTTDFLQCNHCETSFPIYRSGTCSIPWIFSDPENTMLEWKSRLNDFLNSNWNEQSRLRKASKGKRLGTLTKRRLSLLLEGRMTQRLQITELLAPLDLEYTNFDRGQDPASLLRSRVPKGQGMSSYYPEIFRDWCWDNGESEEQLAAIKSVLNDIGAASLGATLTIGAGACRLPYDIHRTFRPKLSVVVDVNPLLLFVASQVVFGESITLVEFPHAPLDESCSAINQECFAPEALEPDASFYFLLADGMHPPLADASFDTVLTPWLIDSIPQTLRDFALAVNRLLPNGGQWINSGTLAFKHKDIVNCLSEEETLECVERCGFEITATDRRRIPYMQSPHSSQWRHESVLSFCARKVRDVDETRQFRHLPEWLLDTSAAIPVLNELAEASSENLLRAQILSAIDGKRSIQSIGDSLAQEYGLRKAEAQNAVRRMLVSLYEAHVDSLNSTSGFNF